ncbi:unnamed protein product [Soboliphyme baturini]|uniref:PIPK domain-containing protein n=1 Tax=Soboliphyme baturini TaxID=241478 RepID=A0A183J1U7_9BILA|nr:unnamed protein product [Soboliphyme baturini]
MSNLSKKKKAHKGRKTKRPITPKWKLFRAKEPFLSVFMWGINHTITELSHVVPPRLLMPGDFKAFSKVKVDNHFFNKDNMSSHFKVKEYCPNVFRSIREKFGIEDVDYSRCDRELNAKQYDSNEVFLDQTDICQLSLTRTLD